MGNDPGRIIEIIDTHTVCGIVGCSYLASVGRHFQVTLRRLTNIAYQRGAGCTDHRRGIHAVPGDTISIKVGISPLLGDHPESLSIGMSDSCNLFTGKRHQ
jgi:hypothetical protein